MAGLAAEARTVPVHARAGLSGTAPLAREVEQIRGAWAVLLRGLRVGIARCDATAAASEAATYAPRKEGRKS